MIEIIEYIQKPYLCCKNIIVRWLKFIIVILFLLISVYVGIMHTYDEKKVFVVEKEISYPLEKLFPQFDNPQNFTKWNKLLLSGEKYVYTYFLPYEGAGSSFSYVNPKYDEDNGQVFIRYVKPNSEIKYEIYKSKNTTPYRIDVKFLPKGEKTKVVWQVETPKKSLILRFMDWVSEDEVNTEVAQSVVKLSNLLSGKVEREIMLSQIKYDSIMIEEQGEKLLLGLNVSVNNQKGNLFRNINISHNKFMNFLTKDLQKIEDEYGLPVLLTEVESLKNKEISYFYGVPLSKQVKVENNNFVFRKLNKNKIYTIYYKGKYENRVKAIGLLLDKIKKDTLQNGILQELFIEPPTENNEVLLKISLPVYK